MAAIRPPLPPRRSIPPIPSEHKQLVQEAEVPNGIAARMASLRLDHVHGSMVQPSLAKPPPVPPRKLRAPAIDGRTESTDTSRNAANAASARAPAIPPRSTRPDIANKARALARRPPPPPVGKTTSDEREESSMTNPSGPLRRRLPPMPSRLPTPPPEPEPEPRHSSPEEDVASYDSCLECHDFSYVDAHSAQFPRHTVTSLDNLAYDLTEPFTTETDKVRAIFTWLHHNIAYDTVSFFSGDVRAMTPESTLGAGLAVCDGYAGLFNALAARVGIQSYKVTGHGKGIGYTATPPGEPVPEYKANHAWNCVCMDGSWRLIDTCWGAGAVHGTSYEPRFTPMWFTSNPAEFGKRHFPEDPSYQLMSEEQGGPVTWEEYIMEPERPLIFVDFYQLNFWPFAIQPSTNYIEAGRYISFQLFKRCEHLSTAESDNYMHLISTADNNRVPLELNSAGGWSAEIYVPGGEVSLFYVKTVNGKDAKGIGMSAFKKASGRTAMTFGGLARWTAV